MAEVSLSVLRAAFVIVEAGGAVDRLGVICFKFAQTILAFDLRALAVCQAWQRLQGTSGSTATNSNVV